MLPGAVNFVIGTSLHFI